MRMVAASFTECLIEGSLPTPAKQREYLIGEETQSKKSERKSVSCPWV
jgi:hypothetical protein